MKNESKLSPPNELGYQFEINKHLTDYAHKQELKISVLNVWKDGKQVSYLLVDEETNKGIEEQWGYEATACAIDRWKVIKKMDEE